MIKLFSTILLISMILLSCATGIAETSASTFKPANERTETAIKEVLNKLNQAYMNRDLEAVLSLIAKDDNIIFIGTTTGDKIIGYENVKTAFQQDFDNFKTLSADYPWIYVTTSGNVALVASDFTGEIVVSDGVKKDITARQTIVLEKRRGKWLIVQSHFSFPAEVIKGAFDEAVEKKQSQMSKEKEDKEIDKTLDSMPITDEHVGKEMQEELTDEKLVDEDA